MGKEVAKLLVVIQHAKMVANLHDDIAGGKDPVGEVVGFFRNGGTAEQGCMHTHGRLLVSSAWAARKWSSNAAWSCPEAYPQSAKESRSLTAPCLAGKGWPTASILASNQLVPVRMRWCSSRKKARIAIPRWL